MKKIIYSTMIACLALAGFTSCNPQDNDDHSLGGVKIPQEALSWNVTQTDEAKQTTFTLTNNSQQLQGVTYYLSTNGTKLTEFPVGASTSITVKSNGTVAAFLYAFSGCDQKMLTWSKDVDWFTADENLQWLGFTEGNDLLEDWKPEYSSWFSPSDWSGGLDPGLDGDIHSGLNFVIPANTGSDQWQAQVHLNGNGPRLSSGKTYDFSIAIESSADFAGDGVTVKPQMDGDDNTFLSADRHKVKKGLNVISLASCAGFDGPFKLALDFAGAPIGTKITVKRVFLTEHNAANATGDTWAFDYKNDANILKEATFNPEFWFSPSDWSGGLNPQAEGTAELFELIVPAGMGSDQWQGQMHLRFPDAKVSSSKKWDFSVVVVADHDIPGMTVKPQQNDNDDVFFAADRHDMFANAPKSFVYTEQDGFNSGFQLCLDVAGAPAGTKIKVYGIYLGEHK